MPPRLGREPPPQITVAQQTDERGRELRGAVGAQVVPARLQGEPLDADRRGDHRAAHRHGFERLDAGPAAHAQGDDVGGAPPHVRADVVDEPRELPGHPAAPGLLDQGAWRIAADHLEPGVRELARHEVPDLVQEEVDAVDVGHPVHGAGESESPRIPRRGVAEEVEVHARGNHLGAGDAEAVAEPVRVPLRDGHDRVETLQGVALETFHLAELVAPEDPFERVSSHRRGRPKISLSTLWVKSTEGTARRAGARTAAWGKSNTTTSGRSASSSATRRRPGPERSVATETGRRDARCRSRVRRKVGLRRGFGQSANRSQTAAISAAKRPLPSGGAGEASTISHAPPFIPRRICVVRILPPSSAGKRNAARRRAVGNAGGRRRRAQARHLNPLPGSLWIARGRSSQQRISATLPRSITA